MRKDEIIYSTYHRCNVKKCKTCTNFRPLTDYYIRREKSVATCKLCYAEKRKHKTRARREIERLNARLSYHRNKERNIAKNKRWREKIGKEQYNHQAKLCRIKREEKTGQSTSFSRRRNPQHKPNCIAYRLRKTYGVQVTAGMVREYLAKYPSYWKHWRDYKESGFDYTLTPTLVPYTLTTVPTQLTDFKLTTLRRARQLYGKRRQRNTSDSSSEIVINSSEVGITN